MGSLCSALVLLLLPVPRSAAGPVVADFRPDPRSVQRYGPAYRYPQAGWIVLHIEGEPYQRGYQHGQLLAPEIAAYLRCCAAMQSPKAPTEGWKVTRTLVNALFVRRCDREYLEEMKGIADGAAAAGARFDERPVDLVDVVGMNALPEIETLPSALEATPTGLEGIRFPHDQPRAMPDPKPMHCSAFAATGPATADGKVVFGHITMFGLYASLHYNVWLDVKPAQGHRVLMQTYPGGIQSGMDYYLNDAGLLVCETTIRQTRFDVQGSALASRIRRALQYADAIDQAVEILRKGNNGLYTNEWLLADVKTNEIAMFELGTAKSRLRRSSKNEWFGDTPGFYWGCNNTKDRDVRLETLASTAAAPANLVWRPSDRDICWQRLYAKHRGKIGVDFGKEAFTTPPVAAYHSLDAKFTTTDLAKQLKTWALFGPPLGRTWEPTPDERQRHPEVRPLVSNPWTILHAEPTARDKADAPLAVDLPGPLEPPKETPTRSVRSRRNPSTPAWQGTLLPKTDADTWLAAAFADYQRVFSLENASRDRLALELFQFRTSYTTSVLAREDPTRLLPYVEQPRPGDKACAEPPLAETRSDLARNDWYRIAAGKGSLVLHELRELLGDQAFKEMMDSFGRQHAGREVTVAEFQAHAAKATGKNLDDFFAYWNRQSGLPSLRLGKATVDAHPKGPTQVAGEIHREGGHAGMTVSVTVETADGEVTKKVLLDSGTTRFTITTDRPPQRVIVDKYNQTAKAQGGLFSILSFQGELEKTLIVYGTGDELPAHREAAESLQRAITQSGSNFCVPLKADRDATPEDLQNHHVLLIGRPDSNRWVDRFRKAFPVELGVRSFTVRNEVYAHPNSALVVAGTNPLNPRYSVVAAMGLSASSTRLVVPDFLHRGQRPAEVLVLPAKGRPKSLVLPARELVREFAGSETKTPKAAGG